ncbi:PTS mannitol transporter subunit IICB [Macrococcus hajekii]|uniref:PTS system mannitol-specific EIICB component n=1 Tax=Macrococcus hajekii TaxID=198482 RepID=A0A4R6BJ92_9STAP|nr:PTS mannitol transporter subunit IICB [Macrococcus hajekii]TDM01626.1 PTS mannitol transporter subunit IICB [Macrococcus hajekii]GGB01599.1 PTS mannitol transporter subunit IICB [Macrococcus hajekii]
MAEQKSGIQRRVQAFGSFLSSMVMPNIPIFIAWGFLTALFIEKGWFPNKDLATIVDPTIHYLIPIMIAFMGGKLVHDVRGGVVGAAATMGIIAAFDQHMLLGAMIIGPLTAWLMKKFDNAVQPRIRTGFEMLVNNFSAGFMALGMMIVSYFLLSPIVGWIMWALGKAVQFLVDLHILPLTSLLIEPAKVLFLNNAINHGVLNPLGINQAAEAGQSILFTLESNPGPGFGILLAYMFFGRGTARATAPGAALIHFVGGIHEIYFPYVLMKPALIIAAIAGGMTGVGYFSLVDFGLKAAPAPGSILAYIAMTPKGEFIHMFIGIALATLVSFIVASLILKFSKNKGEDDIAAATAEMEARKGKKSSVSDALTGASAGATAGTASTSDRVNVVEVDKDETTEPDLLAKYDTENVDAHDYSNVSKVIFACDAGMGSSAMGAGMLRNKFKKAGINAEITNSAINQLPQDAQLVITQKVLTDRAIKQVPDAIHISVDNFLNSPRYDELIANLKQNQ